MKMVVNNNKQPQKYKKQTGKAAEFEYQAYQAMCGECDVADFYQADDYRICFDENKVPLIFSVDARDVCTRVDAKHVTTAFYKWFNYNRELFCSNHVSRKHVELAVKTWMHDYNPESNQRIIEQPLNFRFKSDEGYCFHRLDYDPQPTDNIERDAPIFCEALSRVSNRDPFVVKIGSMFDPGADRKQSIWLYGQKDSGKSFWQALITKLLGGPKNTAAISPELMGSQFWKETLVGKGLWAFYEAPVEFLNTYQYKSLTGDANHVINPKNASLYSVKLTGHIIFASNDKPAIKNDPAVIERLIPVHSQPIARNKMIPEHELERLLERELPYIAWYCKDQYEKHGHRRIDCDQTEIYEAIESGEWDLEALFDTHFVHSPGFNGGREDATVTLSQFYNRIGYKGKRVAKGTIAYDMREYVQRKFRAEFKTGQCGNRTAKIVTNISWRDAHQASQDI